MSERDNTLPSGWAVALISDVSQYFRGVSYHKSDATSSPAEGCIPVLRANNLGDGFDLRDLVFVPSDCVESDQLVCANDIVLAMSSGSKKHVGKSVLATTNMECAFGAFCGLLRPRQGIVPKFMSLQLEGRSFRRYIEESALGTNINNLKSSDLLAYQIVLAPENEQRRIVAKIEELFSELDNGLESLTKAGEQLRAFRQAVLKYAFEGKLTVDWRARNHTTLQTPAEIRAGLAAARRQRWSEPVSFKRPALVEPDPYDPIDVPVFPDTWAVVSMDELSHHITSGSRGWSRYYDRGSCIFVMAQNVRPGKYDSSCVQLVDPPMDNAETHRTRVRKDDLLVTIVGANTGDVCRFPFDSEDHFVCQSVALMRPVAPEYAKYLELYFQAEHGGLRHYRRYIYGAGRPHISFEQLRKTVVPLPSIPEAMEIIRVVDAALSSCDKQIELIEAEISRSCSLRNAVLKSAFAGRLVGQDPSDEPAAALLDRLRRDSGRPQHRRRKAPQDKEDAA